MEPQKMHLVRRVHDLKWRKYANEILSPSGKFSMSPDVARQISAVIGSSPKSERSDWLSLHFVTIEVYSCNEPTVLECVSARWFVRPLVCPSVGLSIRWFVGWSIYASVSLFASQSVRQSVCLSVHCQSLFKRTGKRRGKRRWKRSILTNDFCFSLFITIYACWHLAGMLWMPYLHAGEGQRCVLS